MEVGAMIQIFLAGPDVFTILGIIQWMNEIWLLTFIAAVVLPILFTFLAALFRRYHRISVGIVGFTVTTTYLLFLIEIFFVVLWLSSRDFPLNPFTDIHVVLIIIPPLAFFESLWLAKRLYALEDIPILNRLKAFSIICLLAGLFMFIVFKTHILAFITLTNLIVFLVALIFLIYIIYRLFLKRKNRKRYHHLP